ncbi:MAG TPA: DUF2846 domain-containing protein [Burkholderiales bacterium]|nr:DUF2846 domain-containing protein [Burkholderiales bacterium]
MTRAARVLAGCLLAALGGCASVPQASPERDAEAKQFITHPGVSTLYVYRGDFPAGMDADDSVLYVNGRLIGSTLPGTYFRIELRPGEHLLHGYAHDQGRIRVRAPAGEITFVSLSVVAGASHFGQVAPETAKREIARCCVLMENWTPGQRPLLR